MLKKLFRFILLLGLIAGGVMFYLYHQHFVKANIVSSKSEVNLYIRPDATVETVLANLQQLGVLQDPAAFSTLAEIKNYKGKNIVAGKYQLRDGMTNNELISGTIIVNKDVLQW